MGLMDKVKAQATVLADKAQTGVQQGQTKLQELQTSKQVDHLLRELGASVFLSERGRSQPDSEAKVAAIVSQLDALEAAGTAVTVTTDPTAVPAGGAVPQAGGPAPRPAEPAPPPPGAVPPTDAGATDAAAGGGGFIPQAGTGLPDL
jgi:hypothetical protein